MKFVVKDKSLFGDKLGTLKFLKESGVTGSRISVLTAPFFIKWNIVRKHFNVYDRVCSNNYFMAESDSAGFNDF